MWCAGRVKGETLVLPSHVSYSRITCVCLQGSAKSLELGLRVSLTLRLRSMDQVKKITLQRFFFVSFLNKRGGEAYWQNKKRKEVSQVLSRTLFYSYIQKYSLYSAVEYYNSAYFSIFLASGWLEGEREDSKAWQQRGGQRGDSSVQGEEGSCQLKDRLLLEKDVFS